MERKYEYLIGKYQRRFLEEKFRDYKINRSEAPYLKVIYLHGTMRMNDLIQKLFFHKSHTTRVINSLVNDGYVDKTVDPDDKRGYILSITDKGKIIAQKIVEVLDEWDKLMESFLEKEEIDFLLKMQKKAYERLKIYFQEGDEDGETN